MPYAHQPNSAILSRSTLTRRWKPSRGAPKGAVQESAAGLIKGFTGIDDPYQPPGNAEIINDLDHLRPQSPRGKSWITSKHADICKPESVDARC